MKPSNSKPAFSEDFDNPFRPGAGHMPPFLAGRETAVTDIARLLDQKIILENLVVTGLRGVGKTVLMERMKPLAIDQGWLWVGTDLSEAASLSETNIATRLLADLAPIASLFSVKGEPSRSLGFTAKKTTHSVQLDYDTLVAVYENTPGLSADKLKYVLEMVWSAVSLHGIQGVVFAYDEAQILSDHAAKEEYPLSLLLDVFQSIQRKGIPFMLWLSGLPTLFPKLVEARTFSERMFRVLFLDRLEEKFTNEAFSKPIAVKGSPVRFNPALVNQLISESGGYPYFIQFLGREAFDVLRQSPGAMVHKQAVFMPAILRKLDSDFFSGRWSRVTDRQREFLIVIARLPKSDVEFSVQEVEQASRKSLKKPFSASHITQLLATLAEAGLIYKNRHGRYSFAVPLLGAFIRRQIKTE